MSVDTQIPSSLKTAQTEVALPERPGQASASESRAHHQALLGNGPWGFITEKDQVAEGEMRFRICILRLAVAIALLVAAAAQAPAADFYAYYTKLDYTQPATPEWLAGIPVNAANVLSGGRPDPADAVPQLPAPGPVRWGKYADLVVNVGEGRRLVFSRATGYLPYLQTAKGRSPFRPLVECREDPLCLCSFVRLVEDRPSRIVVHWRHVPDPASVVMTEVVHEYFVITPDGRVRREVRIGTERLDDFDDPANVTVQELFLSPEGLVERSLTRPLPARRCAAPASGRRPCG
jgi:hypothetical protein